MTILSDNELKFLAESLAQDGGELLEANQDSRTFKIAFKNQDKMLTLISAIKSDKRLRNLARINAKTIDGKHILTIDPS